VRDLEQTVNDCSNMHGETVKKSNVALDWHVIGLPSYTSFNRIDRKRLSAVPQACLSFDLTAAVMTRIIRKLRAFAFATFLFVLLSPLYSVI